MRRLSAIIPFAIVIGAFLWGYRGELWIKEMRSPAAALPSATPAGSQTPAPAVSAMPIQPPAPSPRAASASMPPVAPLGTANPPAASTEGSGPNAQDRVRTLKEIGGEDPDADTESVETEESEEPEAGTEEAEEPEEVDSATADEPEEPESADAADDADTADDADSGDDTSEEPEAEAPKVDARPQQ